MKGKIGHGWGDRNFMWRVYRKLMAPKFLWIHTFGDLQHLDNTKASSLQNKNSAEFYDMCKKPPILLSVPDAFFFFNVNHQIHLKII